MTDQGDPLPMAVNDAVLEAAFARIDAGESFARSPLLRRVLRYLVAAECAGEGESLTAYRVAVEAFGKPADFDPALNASVRTEMARLRRLLGEQRQREPDAPGIEIPNGSYRPRVVPPLGRRLASGEDFTRHVVPPSGPGIMMFGLLHSLPADRRHVTIGLIRHLYEELTRYRWLYIVDALDLDPRAPGMFERCVDRYECQFLLRGEARDVPAPDGSSSGITEVRLELMDAIGRTAVWCETFRVGAQSLTRAPASDEVADIAVRVAQTLGAPLGIVTHAATRTLRPTTATGRWAAADLLMRFHLYLAGERTPALHAELKERAELILADAPFFALGWSTLGGLLRDEYVNRISPTATRDGTLGEAERCLQRALELDPTLGRAAFVLACVRYNRGDYGGFRHWLARALELHGNHPEHALWGGTLLCLGGDVEEGIALAERSGLLAHPAPFYRIGTALAYFAAGRRDDALHAVSQLPAELPAYLGQLARAIVNADHARWDVAREACARALGLMPVLRVELTAEVEKWILDPALAARTLALLETVAASSADGTRD